MIYLAQFIFDNNENRKYISGIRKIKSYEKYNNTKFILINESVYSFLKEHIDYTDGTKSIYYVNEEVTVINNIEDLQILESDKKNIESLNTLLNYYKYNMEELVLSRTRMYPYKLYKFFTSYNVLIDAGFTITNTNQEETYIEIINREDDELLNALSDYLDTRDNINLETTVFEKYEFYKDKLMLASSEEEARQIYDEFMSDFQ
jgi:hypothetical protein